MALEHEHKGILSALPAAGVALLPKLTCPLCWPAYTAFLGSLGVGFIDYTPYLLPLTATFLAISLGSLGLLARRRQRIEPFLLGLVAAVAVLAGKFALGSDMAMYAGIALLIVTPLVPWRRKAASCCEASTMAAPARRGVRQRWRQIFAAETIRMSARPGSSTLDGTTPSSRPPT
jgi:hypothetical protein